MTHNPCSLRSIITVATAALVLSLAPSVAPAKTTHRPQVTQTASSPSHPKSPNRGRAHKKQHGQKGSSQKRGAHQSPKAQVTEKADASSRNNLRACFKNRMAQVFTKKGWMARRNMPGIPFAVCDGCRNNARRPFSRKLPLSSTLLGFQSFIHYLLKDGILDSF